MSARLAVRSVVTVAAPGPQGIPGPAGSSDTVILTASMTVSGHRLVTRLPDGGAAYADNTTPAHAAAPLWLTLGAAVSGAEVTVQAAGIVTEPSWSWTPGPLYLGTAGLLTQVVPTAAGGAVFLVQVGYVTGATTIVVDRQPSILLI